MPDFDSAFFFYNLNFMWRYSLVLILICYSCSNRLVHGKKQGFWKEKDTINDQIYISKGRYNRDVNVGTWRYYHQKKLYKKEIYNGSSCKVFLYDEQGKLIRSGFTKMEIKDSESHWYYEGYWINYNNLEKPESYDVYAKGEQVGETRPYYLLKP